MGKSDKKSKYIDEFKSDIKALIAETNRYLMLIAKHNGPTIAKLSRIDFENNHDGYEVSKKYDKRVDKLDAAYSALRKYKYASNYADLSKQFMDDLKKASPDDSDADTTWKSVYNKYKRQTDDIKYDITRAYHDFIHEYTELIHYVNEKQRKGAISKMTKDGNDFTIQEYAQYSDELKQIIYEKCNAGEYDISTREMLLARLDDYKESRAVALSGVYKNLNDFMEGTISAEDLDTVLDGYYTENPDIKDLFCPDYIDDMHDIMMESIEDELVEDLITEDEAIEKFVSADTVYEYDMNDYFASVFSAIGTFTESTEKPENEVPSKLGEIYEAYVHSLEAINLQEDAGVFTTEEAEERRIEVGNKFSELVDAFEGESVEYDIQHVRPILLEQAATINEKVANGEITEEAAYSQYVDAIKAYYETFSDILQEVEPEDLMTEASDPNTVDTKKLRKLNGILVNIASAPVGPVRWSKASKIFECYDEIHKPAIPFTSLKFRRLNPTKDKSIISRYCGKDMQANERTNCNGEGEKGVYEVYIAESGHENVFIMMRMSTNKKKNWNLRFYGISPEYRKHEKYYKTGAVMKLMGQQSSTEKAFVGSVLRECNQIIQKEKSIEKKIGKTEDNASSKLKSMIKESGMTINSTYDRVLEKINAMYESGDIDLDKREALIIQARQKLYC